jgi:serine phosphatase RsbU (regulator of sigma subunit)
MVRARAVLNVALRAGDEVIGNLHFYNSTEGRVFKELHVNFMRNLAASLQLAVRNARLYAEERHVADTLQRALLKTPDQVEGIEFDCLYRSATQEALVGGDFYDLFAAPDGRIGVLIGDVSGKGLQASTLTSLVRNTIVAYSYEQQSPAEVVQRTSRVVYDSVPTDMFMTLIFGMLDLSTGRLEYCNAGHPAGLVLRDGECTEMLPSTGPLVGAFPELSFENSTTYVSNRDVVLLYTDGVIEAKGAVEMFGEDRLRDVVQAEGRDGSPGGLPARVFQRLIEFTGGSIGDDIAMLAFSLSAPPATAPPADYLAASRDDCGR